MKPRRCGRGRDWGPHTTTTTLSGASAASAAASAAAIALCGLLLLPALVAASPQVHSLTLGEFGQWSSNALLVERGDTVRWCWSVAAPGLNVVCDDLPNAQPPEVASSFPFRSGNPVTSSCFEVTIACEACYGQTFYYSSDTAEDGTYSGSITVRNADGSSPTGSSFDGGGGSGGHPHGSSTGCPSGRGTGSHGPISSTGGAPYVGTGSALPPNGLRAILVLRVSYPEFVSQYEAVLIQQLAAALQVEPTRFALLLASAHQSASTGTEVWIDLMDGEHRHHTVISSVVSGAAAVAPLTADDDAAALYQRLTLELSGSGTGVLNDFSATALIRALKQVCADGRITAQCEPLLPSDDEETTRSYLPSALVASILSAFVALSVCGYLLYYYFVQRPRLMARRQRQAQRNARLATAAGLCPLTRSASGSDTSKTRHNSKSSDGKTEGKADAKVDVKSDGAAGPTPSAAGVSDFDPAVAAAGLAELPVAVAVIPTIEIRTSEAVCVEVPPAATSRRRASPPLAATATPAAAIPSLTQPTAVSAAVGATPTLAATAAAPGNSSIGNGNGNGNGNGSASVTIDVDLGAIELAQLQEIGLTVYGSNTTSTSTNTSHSGIRNGSTGGVAPVVSRGLPTIREADAELDSEVDPASVRR